MKTLQEFQEYLGRCEVCGEQAVVCLSDYREISPEFDEASGKLFQRFETVGDPHRYCGKHKRETIRYPQETL